MSDKNEQDPDFVPDGEAGGDGPEEPLYDVPDDASALDVDSPVEAPAEPTAAERAASGQNGQDSPSGQDGQPAAEQSDWEKLAQERTLDLQRLHAEYVNYKRRVDRDRNVARDKGIETVVSDLLPVLDSIAAAKEHGDLSGAFKMVADELEKVTTKYGLVTFGEVGEPFDPTLHEALMHVPYEGETDVTVVSAVMQHGAKLGDRVIRPARVGVADPS